MRRERRVTTALAMDRPQFSLRSLVCTTTVCCLFAAAAHWFGVIAVTLAIVGIAGFCLVTFVWSMAYVRAPEFVKYATVVGSCGAMLLSLLSMSILQSREEARRYVCI